MPNQRMEMSKTSKYYVDKHRKYELIHFCKQYRKWKEALRDVEGWSVVPTAQEKVDHGGYISDPVARAAAIRKFYSDRIAIIDKAAYETDPVIGEYVIRGILDDLSYDDLRMSHDIPCSKGFYYDRKAKFIWILDKLRG